MYIFLVVYIIVFRLCTYFHTENISLNYARFIVFPYVVNVYILWGISKVQSLQTPDL